MAFELFKNYVNKEGRKLQPPFLTLNKNGLCFFSKSAVKEYVLNCEHVKLYFDRKVKIIAFEFTYEYETDSTLPVKGKRCTTVWIRALFNMLEWDIEPYAGRYSINEPDSKSQHPYIKL